MPPTEKPFTAQNAALLIAIPVNAFACTQVWVPAIYAANGNRYVGRAENSYARYVKIFGIEEAQDRVTYSSEESKFSWQSDKRSHRYTYVRDLPSEWNNRTDAYSEAGINEKGVSCSATLTTDMNPGIRKIDPLSDTGIGEYNYASVVLGESATAREGVELLGGLVDEYGTSGNDQVVIADTHETWLFCGLSGHQWAAFQLPEDQVSVNPNIGGLFFDVDLDDKATCLHSDGIISMPKEHGLLKTFEDGTPDIAGTYGKQPQDVSNSSWTRYAQGRAYFENALVSGKDYTLEQNGAHVTEAQPLFFKPGRGAWTTFEIIRSLAARGEQTEDLNANTDANLYAIGNDRMLESHIFEIRDHLTDDIATIQWEALSRSEFSVAIPLYSALLTEVSPYFGDLEIDTNDHAGYNEDAELAMQEEPENSLVYVLMDINTLCSVNRSTCAEGMRAYLDALQNQIIEQHGLVDALMQATSPDQRTDLANRAEFSITEQTYLKTKAALDELRAYLKSGETTNPFVPSDLNAETGTLKQPITYAASLIAPRIIEQPVSAMYEQGAQTIDLSVKGEVNDGIGAIAYEWFKMDGDTATTTGNMTANLPVSSENIGKATYFCRITNAAGLSTDSQMATVTITPLKEEPAEKPDEDPTEKPTSKPDKTPQNMMDGKREGGNLPQTGDIAGIAAAIGCVGTGISAVGLSIARRRKN